jgi:hypothetical protein
MERPRFGSGAGRKDEGQDQCGRPPFIGSKRSFRSTMAPSPATVARGFRSRMPQAPAKPGAGLFSIY